MKADLFTYHFSENYCGLYQVYRLREWLRKHTFEARFGNCRPTNVEQDSLLHHSWKSSQWRRNANVAYTWQAHKMLKQFGLKVQRANFDSFQRDTLGVTWPWIYDRRQRVAQHSHDALRKVLDEADLGLYDHVMAEILKRLRRVAILLAATRTASMWRGGLPSRRRS